MQAQQFDQSAPGQVDAYNAGEDFARAKVHYVCGSCGRDNTLDSLEPVRCGQCGHRILYKKRERKLLQYEAR